MSHLDNQLGKITRARRIIALCGLLILGLLVFIANC